MEPAVKHRVQFYIEDAMTMGYPDNFYDVIYRFNSKSQPINYTYISVVILFYTSQRNKDCLKSF